MACHKVMEPEYTAFQRSPHARVGCAGCHIGPGAQWFVKAKISGAWQLVAVAFDLYPRPIPTPVHSLRPSNGTCEQCHWPTKFLGERLKVRTHYRRGRGQHRAQDGADGQGRRQAGAASRRASTGTWTRTIAPLPRRPDARNHVRDRVDGPGRGHDQGLQGRRDRPRGHGVADDGLRGLPQPGVPHLPQPGVRDRPGARGRPHRPLAALHQARGPAHPDREGVRVACRGARGHRGRGAGVLRAELSRPRRHAGGRAGGQGAGRRLCVEQFPAHEGDLEHCTRTTSATSDSPGCFRCHDNKHKTGRRREDRQEVRHLPQRRGRGRKQFAAAAGARDPGTAAGAARPAEARSGDGGDT